MNDITYSRRGDFYYADGEEIDPLAELIERNAEINRLQGAIKRHDLDYIELSAILLESRRGLVSAKHFGEHISNMLKRVDREALRLLERQGGEA